MADYASVEKTVTEAMLQAGQISVGAAEQARLGLPDHSDVFDVIAGDETLPVVWTAGRRVLAGEALLDYLQDSARVGDLVRVERRAAVLSLVVQAPLRGFDATRRPSPPHVLPPQTPSAAKATVRARRVASRGDRYRLRQRDEYVWHDGVGFLKSANNHLANALRNRGWDPRDAVEIRLMGEELATLDQFEELLALDAAHIEHMPHQEAAARTVLTRLGGRAVLADEVGLGKTVEAGLVIKELLLRGLADRILIVCPAPLREQWRDEMKAKFDEEFEVITSGASEAFGNDRLIMTMQLALRNERRLRVPYDLVVIDEAHRLTGSGARRTREVFGELLATAPRALLLTATPVQNSLLELYRLVELLRPGTFRSQQDFMSRYVDARDPRRPVNTTELRSLVRSVIVRTTREQAGVDRVQRMPPRDQGVVLTPPERELYDLIVDTLRHRMTAQGDHMRRRNLALRLTASPEAIARSALRAAERHPDTELRKILAEIGHLAGDIRHTAREQAALAIIQDWLNEHGRVLVFTQHTETLLGIQRLLDEAGIATAPFHGSMAHSARSKSVADFRSGAARVLISTDSGAEGQNLQVSNCVLNYDLPWNPMRVEQRIGRVHRLTQTRNVYIANLFARDTLDEHVYRLLHDKLAMFELLFGQVVTVLGELDGKQDSTMEGRVLEALYERDDAQMRKRLDALGRELEQARGRAVEMINTGGDLNKFLAEKAQDRRERAASPQARELLPDAAKPRKRQRDVEWFVREFLGRAGAALESPSEGFTIVTLTPELSAALDDREQLYLAFTHAALDAHPEAELCVVGSEVFDEIMHALRERGDLTGTVARVPSVDARPRIAHVPEISLVDRRVEPAPDWSARATFRVQEGEATGNQYIKAVDIGELPKPGRRREELHDGAPLPAGLTDADVLAAVTDRATARLRQDLAEARKAELARHREAQAVMAANLRRQLAELEAQERRGGVTADEYRQQRRRLERAVDTAEQARTASDTELRAELLTLELHGADTFVVVETWRHEAGSTFTIRYPWMGPKAKPRLTCAASGRRIATLAACADRHVVDATAVARCVVCAHERCAACGPAMVSACLACGADVCGVCRDQGPLCPGCRNPERTHELDRLGECGWSLGQGATLLVGAHHAVLTAADGDRTILVEDGDPRRRLRAVAARFGLCPSSGLLDGPATPTDAELTDGALWHSVERSVWWTTSLDGGTDVDEDVAGRLPDLPAPPARGERESGLSDLMARLRRREAAPETPALVAMPFVIVQRVDSENGELVFRELWYTGTNDPALAVHEHLRLSASDHTPVRHGLAVAAASLGALRLHIDRLNHAYLLRIDPSARAVPSETVLVARVPGASAPVESTLAAMVADVGVPPDHAVVRHTWPGVTLDELTEANAAPGTTASRRSAVVWALTADRHGHDITELPADLATAAGATSRVVVDGVLHGRLDELAGAPTTVALAPCLSVEETWRSAHGTTTRRYLVAPSAPLDRRLLEKHLLVLPGTALDPRADDGTTDRPLTVDSSGHLHDPTNTVSCSSCDRQCGTCCAHEMKIDECRECRRPACIECRTADGSGIPVVSCERCDDRSCQACSHRLTVSPCALCGRRVCPSCRASDATTCETCSDLDTASQEEIAALPDVLAAGGLDVLIGHDTGGSVAVLLGAHRCEVAVVSDGQVRSWRTAARDPELLAARLAVARRCGSGDVAISVVDVLPSPLPADALRLRRTTQTTFLWEATKDSRAVMGNVQGLPREGRTRPGSELVRDLLSAVAGESSIEPMPSAAHTAKRRLERLRDGRGPYSPAVRVAVTRHKAEDVVYLDERGLCRRSPSGVGFVETVSPWRTTMDTPEWATQGWDPQPEVLAAAETGDVMAVLVAVGRHARLGTRVADEPTVWYAVSDDLDDLLRAAAGRALLGRPARVSVTAMATSSTVEHPVIAHAHRQNSVSFPFAEATSPEDCGRRPLPMLDVARELGISPATVMVPAADRATLPTNVAKSLRAMVEDRLAEPMSVKVGLRVRDTWLLPNRGSLIVEFLVHGGETVGYLVDQATGRPLSVAQVCRTPHTVEHVDICASCHQATCGACEDGVRTCGVCGAGTCKRCGATDTHCGACARLRRLGRLGRVLNGVGRADEAWHGKHGAVEVTVRRVGDEWSVERVSPSGRQVLLVEAGERLTRVRALLPA